MEEPTHRRMWRGWRSSVATVAVTTMVVATGLVAAATVGPAGAGASGTTAASGQAQEPAWLKAKQSALAQFTPPPPASVTMSAAGTGTVTGTSFHKYQLDAAVRVGPTRSTTCKIVGELLVPDGTTAAHPQPAVMSTNGFGGSWTSSTSLGPAEMAVSRDYVALTYSGLGFGGSGCQIELDNPTWDGLAGSELISWLGVLPEVRKQGKDDPVVGMVGGSYGGAVQFSTAELDPRLDAIVPVITWNDLAYSLAPNNDTQGTTGVARRTTEPGVLKWEWASLFFGDGMATPLEYPTAATPSTFPGFDPAICRAYVTSVSLGYPDRATVTMLRHDSMVDFWPRLHLPVLLAQGEDDSLFNIQEAVDNYRELRADGDPVTLVLQSWGHSDLTPAPGEFTFTPPFDGYENVLVSDFFAKWLRGESVSTGAPVQYFRPWVHYTGNAAPAYGSASSWPVGSAETFDLSAPLVPGTNGALVSSPSAAAAGSASFANPPGGIGTSYSETSYGQGTAPLSTVPPTDAPGTYVAFESAPLAEATDVVGIPTVTVELSSSVPAGVSPATDPVVFAKLYGIAPTGAVTLVDRLVSPVRVPLTPAEVTIDLPGIVHRYPAGERLELVLSAGDTAYLGNRAADTYTVSISPAQPGVLQVPVVPASAQEVSAPPTGD